MKRRITKESNQNSKNVNKEEKVDVSNSMIVKMMMRISLFTKMKKAMIH